jgi:peptidyl-prolyl cis-trans isomerase D
MLEFIRTHKRLMQFILLLFIIPSFAFVGIESYSRFRENDNAVAKVAGQSITQQEWDSALREQSERLRQRLGEQFDPKILENPEAKRDILESLIKQRALAAEVARHRLSVSDQNLQQSILAIPGLVGADGKFDTQRYKTLLAAQGMLPAMFEARLRQDLSMQQASTAIQASSFAPRSVTSRLSDINDQEREVQEMMFNEASYLPQVKLTNNMLKAYYDQHGAQFEIPENVKVEYVVLDKNAVESQISLSDADIKAYYEQNIKRYSVEEQRRASHILISLKKDAAEADKAAAKSKAEGILLQLRKNPADFVKLAKQYSQDPGSAELGGDLGFFGKGMMVKPFEDVAYKLKQGEISDLVQSEFGYHIIMLTGVKPASVKPLDEVKTEITAEIKKQLATKKYTELAEVFTNTVYEQSDSLKPVADKLKLKIETASNLTRQPQAANSWFNNKKFLNAIFSDDSIKNKRNTEAVEVAPNTLIAGHIVEYKPATKRPFEEVKATITVSVKQIEAAKIAIKEGKEKIASLKANNDNSGFSGSKKISHIKDQGLNPLAVDAVMKADIRKLPTFVGVEFPGKGFGIYRINKVEQTPTPDVARRQGEQEQLANILSQQEMSAYLELLKQKANVQIIKSKAQVVPNTRE